jgi:hypothetical protein
MDSTALNYDAGATFQPGVTACNYPVSGCTNSAASNYNSNAQVDVGCIIEGCMDSNNPDYNPLANTPPLGANNGGCRLVLPGYGTTARTSKHSRDP